MEHDAAEKSAHRFRPFNWDVGAVNVGRRSVLQILETRIARFLGLSVCVKSKGCVPYLGKARLVSEVEKAADAVFTRLKVEVLHKTEPGSVNGSLGDKHGLRTPCKDLCPGRRSPCTGQSCRSEKQKQRASRQWSRGGSL